VYSYIDDINIFVDGRVANAVAEEVKEIFSRHRLSLSESKCRFLVNEESVLDIDVDLGNNIFRIENDGMVLLGSKMKLERLFKKQGNLFLHYQICWRGHDGIY
jgi:hypothetical protein